MVSRQVSSAHVNTPTARAGRRTTPGRVRIRGNRRAHRPRWLSVGAAATLLCTVSLWIARGPVAAANLNPAVTPSEVHRAHGYVHPFLHRHQAGVASTSTIPHLGLPLAAAHDAVPVLMYHDIEPESTSAWVMTPAQFDAEMAFLHNHGFHTITPAELYAAMNGEGTLPTRPVLLTFDDGYRSFYTYAYPVLERYHMHATLFMISGFIGHRGFLTRDDLRTLADSGLVDVESHTVDHAHLSKLPPQLVRWELVQSRADLQSLLGRPVDDFCYPYGDFTATTVHLVASAGYRLAFTCHEGYAPLSTDPLRIPRLEIYGGMSLRDFEQLLSPSLS